jgi:GxxExxY protein
LRVESEVGFTASYRGHDLGLAYRADLIVEGAVVIELKCVEALQDVHRAQLLTYLRLSGLKLGLLLNFNDLPIAKGVKRMVNKL